MRLRAFSRTKPMRRFGKVVERATKRIIESALDVAWPVTENGQLPSAAAVRKILFVQPNFRIGNTVLATALVPAVRTRYPNASLDFLAADTTAPLLDGLPIDRLHLVSRDFLSRPWRFTSLFSRLHAEKFDLAVDGGMGSYSGALYGFLSGARRRIGFDGRGRRFLTTRLPISKLRSYYDGPVAFAQALGVNCATRPLHPIVPRERTSAIATLQEHGLASNGHPRPFVGIFIGGHLAKRWPSSSWIELIGRLYAQRIPLMVFSGPEERAVEAALQAQAPPNLPFAPPQSLRGFAALLAQATVVVTPDSGPMHLAAAVGVPTISVLQRERSRFFAPQGTHDRVLLRPDSADVWATLRDHPRWRDLAA